jgi:RNA polymerase sigma-70 factor (ECF subfamily)
VTDEPSDAELLARSGCDPEAFRALYERWAEPLLAFCYRRTFDAEVALELVAETFAIAYAKRERYRDRGRAVGAWLYGIARNEVAQYQRRQRVELKAVRRFALQMPALDEESTERIEELVDAERWRATLASALALLSTSERRAVQLRVIDQLDYPIVAAQLGCSEQAARVRVHRGVTRLAASLEVMS